MQKNDILNLFNQLTDFQKEHLNRELRGYVHLNEFVESLHYAFCCVCGINFCFFSNNFFMNSQLYLKASLKPMRLTSSMDLMVSKVHLNGRQASMEKVHRNGVYPKRNSVSTWERTA